MSLFETLVKENPDLSEEDIRNATLEYIDPLIGEYAGKEDPEIVLDAVSEYFGMPKIVGGFDDTKTTEQKQTESQNIKYLKDALDTSDVMKVDAQQGVTQSEDATATMNVDNMMKSVEQGNKNKASIESYRLGMKTLPIGASVLMQDFTNWVQDKADDDFTKEDYNMWATEWAKENQDRIDKLNKTAGFKEDDIFTPDLFGQLTAEFLTLPAGGLKAIKGVKWLKDLRATTQAAIVEGGVATVGALGEGKSYEDAAVSGLMTAGLTKVGGEALVGVLKFIDDPAIIKNIVSGKASDKQTLDYLIRSSGETEQALNGFYSNYAEAVGKNVNELNEVDKMLAIVKNSESGSKFKTEAEYYGEGILAKTNYFENQIKNLFDKELQGASIPADKLNEFLKGASKNYAEIKDTLVGNFDTDIFIPKASLDNMVKALRNASTVQTDSTVNKVISQLQEGVDTPLGIEELLNLKKDINALNLSGVKGFKQDEVRSYIDNLVEAHFNKAGKEEATLANKLWGQANARYAQKKALESGDNWVAELILKKGKEKISTDDFANAVMSQKERGAYSFNQLKDFIGEDATAEVEKQIIKNIFEKEDGLNSSLEYIRGFDFITESGKQLRSELIRLEGVIPKESSIKLLQRFIGSKDVGSVGWSDNLVNKFKYSVIGKTYSAIMTRMPSATPERAFRTLGDRLKKGVGDIKINIKEDPSLQKAFEDELTNLRTDIDRLKQIGQDRTNAQNQMYADLKIREHQIQKQLPRKAGDRGIIQAESTKFENIKNLKETTRTRETLESEIVEESIPAISNNKTAGKDIIDVDIIDLSRNNKKLTPEQATRNNELVSKIEKNMRTIEARKKGLKYLKKQSQIDSYNEEIRKLEAENITFKKKIPKL